MNFRILGPLIALLFLITACSSSEKIDTSTVEGAFALAEKYDKDERYEEAIAQYSAVKNKFPYSKFATESELRVADIHFKREAFIEAQSAYEVFKELHPKHPRSDYVTFRLAMSFFNQVPSTIDRDLSLAHRAIQYFDEVLRSYPESEHVKEAGEYKQKAKEMLAEKEFYIANFYYIRDMYESALGRFESLLKNYPESELVPKTFAAASRSALALSDKKRAAFYLDQLKERFPNSQEYSLLKSEIEDELTSR